MTNFVLETYVPGGSHERYSGEVDGLRRATGPHATAGGVRYVASYLVPADEMAFHLIEAATTDDATRIASLAGIEAERIVEAVDVDPGRWTRGDDMHSGGNG